MIKKEKLLIIDAHALIHRAYHALPPLTTRRGEPIGAVYGFLRILLSALKEIKPQYLAVTFDSAGKNFRHKLYPKYKANRKETDLELIKQFPIVEKIVRTFGFTVYKQAGYEADDLIGTICKQFDNDGRLETIIVSGDLDLLQLVDKNTKVLKLQKGVKETLLYDQKTVKEKHGFTPKQVVDYKGLRGDASDNIPGVAGIGEKGAVELLQKFGSLEGAYQNLDALNGRLLKALRGHKKEALLSKKLATIEQNAPINFDLQKTKIRGYDQEAIAKILQHYEFKTLLPQLSNLPGFVLQEGLFAVNNKEAREQKQKTREKNFSYQLIGRDLGLKEFVAKISKQKEFAVDTETTGLNPLADDLVGLSFSWRAGEGFFLPCKKIVPQEIKNILENKNIHKTGHNIKFDIEVLHSAKVKIAGVVYDTMVASYLLNPGSRGHGLDNLAFVEFGHRMQSIEELIGKGKNQISMADVAIEKVSWYSCEDADFSWRLYEKFQPLLRKEKLDKLINEIEIPTINSLVAMEENGVRLDVAFLQNMSKKLHRRLRELELKIHQEAKMEFNVASNLQLKKVLFQKLHLPTNKLKKTKTGFSTAASELLKLRGTHPIIALLEEFRELSKLTNTYIDTLPKLIQPGSGRVHTSFNQTITATGRLSSSSPNLQNIPIRTEVGREIRKAFIPEVGKKIVSLDYSQIELRVVAHLANDPVMIRAFQDGEDIHTRTAAELNDCAPAQVSKEMRRQAKAINFGILYGMGVMGIVRDSGCSREEAQLFLDKYFSVHKGIADYLAEVKTQATKNGYAQTLFGRKRYLPDLQSRNPMLKSAAERAAVNLPVQGTAADLMKMAVVIIQNEISQNKITARMLLQVHDELVFEIKTSEVKKESKKIQQIMENVHKLKVPLAVDAEFGDNWGELKNINQ
ncbi:MAG: DNA polymerase I [Candidatus Kerfeldbacteria bacterium RIFOXYA2_FULL_38_24]|uniref:DNA polymerase I n=1 Tax=Candidatus Kerfeldbacteria bacterium RIFOXYB2_FULL_38_14 TaxID=1798547 RepID=A0A1G2BIF3_9BACT|nr:MAG: DNA polymerase I [Candidatus Kerfeldbacteria bacterium RIFOXYB2_FULL_38_14]OGY88210.1 MAG: DNA polymerase I [Candidatus Kerfeldbacteria bacterium RIFOXYA2_FULL_38_24]OGY90049.1 MAG: DNA polymerase I [Candidatus Kerfeldbacteria bacterium RIFOXYC2_FULL_38_9]